jgi:hypothetical protein
VVADPGAVVTADGPLALAVLALVAFCLHEGCEPEQVQELEIMRWRNGSVQTFGLVRHALTVDLATGTRSHGNPPDTRSLGQL